MIASYFKYAFRNLLKHRGHTLINLFGLSFSIAIVIIIYLYVIREMNCNRFQEKRHRIYQMYSSWLGADSEVHYSAHQGADMAGGLMESIPGIEATCRFKTTQAFVGSDEDLFQENIGFVDSSFFDMFTYRVIAGDREDPLREIKSLVLTETLARKLFPDRLLNLEDLIGRTVKFPEAPPGNLYTVTAVIADPPDNSSFNWSALVRYENSDRYSRSSDFGGDSFTYIMLDERNDRASLERNAQALVEPFYGEAIRQFIQQGNVKEGEHNFRFHFIPLTDTYLHMNFIGNFSYVERGNLKALYILSGIGILILLIACFNYIMISVGTAMNRIDDFGMMQVAGGRRWQILAQFIVESFLLTLVSLFLGIVLAEQLLPLFNGLADEDLKFGLYSHGVNYLFLFVILAFIVGVTSLYVGSYLLRRSKPVTMLRREMLSMRRNGVARLSVILQFFIAITLMISGGIIMKQLNFMVNRDVGFDRDNILVLNVDFDEQRISTLKDLILQSPDVKSVTMGDRNFNSGSLSQSLQNKEGEMITLRFLRVDPDYLKTLDIELLEGRNLEEADAHADSIPRVLVNETLVRELGLDEAVGERLDLGEDGSSVDIVGVVKDFHFDSMHDKIEPLMLHNIHFNRLWYLFVKPRDGRIQEVVQHCEKSWNEVVPELTWEYTFLTDILDGQYKTEDRWSRIVAYASGIAILLSCLGLMGISGLLVARRFKEVGIRKAHGSTIGDIVVLLNIDILKWVALAYLVASPAAWLIMHRWLQDFAYRTSLSWWIFVLAGLVTFLISVLTITLQIYRVARQNPVRALRYE